MITKKLVLNFDLGGGVKVDTYILLYKNKPILGPNLYLFNMAKSGFLISAIKTYSDCLKKFFNVLFDAQHADSSFPSWTAIKESQMNAYLNAYLKQDQKFADSTVDLHITVLSMFYSFAYDYGLISSPKNFSFNYEKTDELMPKSSMMNELYMDEKIFKNDVLASVKSDKPFLKERDELILCLGYYAGFRTHEVVISGNLNVIKLREQLPKLKANDWKPQSIDLKILGKGIKTRMVPIPPKLVDRIYKFLWGRASFIKTGSLISTEGGRDLIDDQFASDLFTSCKRVILSGEVLDRKAWDLRDYHKLRYCYGTNAVAYCYNNQYDPWIYVPQWMGHSDRGITFDYVFFDAVLHQRHEVMSKLALEKTEYAKRVFGKGIKK